MRSNVFLKMFLLSSLLFLVFTTSTTYANPVTESIVESLKSQLNPDVTFHNFRINTFERTDYESAVKLLQGLENAVVDDSPGYITITGLYNRSNWICSKIENKINACFVNLGDSRNALTCKSGPFGKPAYNQDRNGLSSFIYKILSCEVTVGRGTGFGAKGEVYFYNSNGLHYLGYLPTHEYITWAEHNALVILDAEVTNLQTSGKILSFQVCPTTEVELFDTGLKTKDHIECLHYGFDSTNQNNTFQAYGKIGILNSFLLEAYDKQYHKSILRIKQLSANVTSPIDVIGFYALNKKQEVFKTQTMLKVHAQYSGKIDGVWGPATSKALAPYLDSYMKINGYEQVEEKHVAPFFGWIVDLLYAEKVSGEYPD